MVNIGDTLIANKAAADANIIASAPYNTIKPTAGNAAIAANPIYIAVCKRKRGNIIAITHFKIGQTRANKCKTGISATNTGLNIVTSRLAKKNIKSKFLTPSFTGNLFVVVVHLLSVISFIPKCRLLLNPHFHLSIKLAIV